MLCSPGEWQTPISKPIFFCLGKSPTVLSKAKKSQCRELLLNFKVQSFGTYRQLLSGLSLHPGSLACSQLLSISGSLLEPTCGARAAMGHVVAGAPWSRDPG